MSKYINWRCFESLHNKVRKNVEGELFNTNLNFESKSSSSPDTACQDIINNKMSAKFLCEAPIGSGKSTAIRNWVLHTIEKRKYIIIVPTVNIAFEFYAKMILKLTNEDISVCFKQDSFKTFKNSLKDEVPVIITTCFTAKICLETDFEKSYHNKWEIESK